MSEQDELAQILAQWCEEGILERPRITEGSTGVKYRLTEKGRKALAYLANHPEVFGEEGQALLKKLGPLFGED